MKSDFKTRTEACCEKKDVLAVLAIGFKKNLIFLLFRLLKIRQNQHCFRDLSFG